MFSQFIVIEVPYTEAYLGPCQTSIMEVFAKLVYGEIPLTIFAKTFILDVFQDSIYASVAKTQKRLLTTADLISLGMSQNIYLSNISIVFTTILGTLSFGHLEITHHLISIFNTFKVRLLGLLVNNLLLQILIALSTNIFYESYS